MTITPTAMSLLSMYVALADERVLHGKTVWNRSKNDILMNTRERDFYLSSTVRTALYRTFSLSVP